MTVRHSQTPANVKLYRQRKVTRGHEHSCKYYKAERKDICQGQYNPNSFRVTATRGWEMDRFVVNGLERA